MSVGLLTALHIFEFQWHHQYDDNSDACLTAIFWINQYQNVSILDFIGAKDDGGGDDNWSYKTFKAAVKISLPTNQHPVF